MSKICKNCWNKTENPLLKYCKKCTYENSFYNLKQTRINIISNKKKERIKNWWSEALLFETIKNKSIENWTNRCWICDKEIKEFWASSFPHILSKGMYKAFRLFENNIWLTCNDINTNSCHHKLDKVVKQIQRDIWHKEFENLIASWEDVKDLINNYKKYEMRIW